MALNDMYFDQFKYEIVLLTVIVLDMIPNALKTTSTTSFSSAICTNDCSNQ